MNFVDLFLIALILLAGLSGWRQGAIASALAFFGVAVGAVAGILLAPHVIRAFDGPRLRTIVGIVVLVALVAVGQIAGVVLGRAARNSLRHRAAQACDSITGSVLQVLAFLCAAWLIAIPLASVDDPAFAKQIRSSRVLSSVNQVAPDWLSELPREFSALLDTSGLPDVLGPFGRTPIRAVDPPNPALANSPVVNRVRGSVVKIIGSAPQCSRALEGSGFVVSDGRVITNAHVVAGTSSVRVMQGDRRLDARVVEFDPRIDVAILAVRGLTAPPLVIAESHAKSGSDAIALGYPGGGPFVASAERIRETVRLSGHDIYSQGDVVREVYTVRGSIRQGNSGGPLIDSSGRVLGMVFGEAVDDRQTGFVLTSQQLEPFISEASTYSTTTSTQQCVTSS